MELLGYKYLYLIKVLFGGKVFITVPECWTKLIQDIFVRAKGIYIWNHCEENVGSVRLRQLFFLHFYISTFLYFYTSIFLHFYIFTFLHIFLHLKPYCEEAEVPTGRFGFSFHHFVKWKRSCMHKLNCKTRRNTIPNCPIALGGERC